MQGLRLDDIHAFGVICCRGEANKSGTPPPTPPREPRRGVKAGDLFLRREGKVFHTSLRDDYMPQASRGLHARLRRDFDAKF